MSVQARADSWNAEDELGGGVGRFLLVNACSYHLRWELKTHKPSHRALFELYGVVDDSDKLRNADLERTNCRDIAAISAIKDSTIPEQYFENDNWRLTQVQAPSTGYPSLVDPPATDLELDFVYGCRVHDVRGAVRYVSTGEVVYPAAKLVVKLTLGAAGKQSFGMGHTDDVYALAVSPDGKQIASGQLGELPLIILWDAETMSIRHKISGFHSDGISLLAYSPDGSMLASCGLDQQNSIAIYR